MAQIRSDSNEDQRRPAVEGPFESASNQDTLPVSLLSVPPEILIKIICFLPSSDILACKLTNKHLYELIKGSAEIEYHTALLYCGAEDNPSVPLPLPEKLRAIHSTERAWSRVESSFTTSVEVPGISAKWYDIMDGMFWWSGYGQSFIHYLKLPDEEDDEIVWRKFQCDKPIVSFTVCIYEQDLIAIVTTTPVSEEAELVSHSIDLHLLQFSTGKAHPKARESCIHLMSSRAAEPMEFMQAVGEHLTFIGTTSDGVQDQIIVLNWQRNEVKMNWQVPPGRYLGHRFLTTDLLVFANKESLSIDIFRIPSTPDLSPPVPILVLNLPRISDGYAVESFHLCIKPNPRKEPMRKAPEDGSYVPNRSYLADPDDAIFIFRLQVNYCFTFVVHRKALVDLAEKHGSPARINGSSGQDPVTRAGCEPNAGGPEPHSDHSREEVQQSDDNQLTTASHSAQPTPPTLNYSVWGPSITRWFSSSRFRMVLTTWGQRHVQIDIPPFDDETASILVLDFNPARVEKYIAKDKAKDEAVQKEPSTPPINQNEASEPQTVGSEPPEFQAIRNKMTDLIQEVIDATPSLSFYLEEGDDEHLLPDDEYHLSDSDDADDAFRPASHANLEEEANIYVPGSIPDPVPDPLHTWCTSSYDLLEPAEVFAEPVVSGLPYVVSARTTEHAFDAVIMDEKRILGLKKDFWGFAESIEIMHIG